ncbi:hypothetical protein PF005_g31258 [Phytophthora fragariae]|uniref:Secreted protein n=1 Tax=Phytophthora fragariae TaxID=53985 RepID=A0A6A3DK31_9STRA|nr:hypothetical protein PF003_g29725 [Phytophthora fragariae]KAE8918488.1 hypothetical protein PF009_g31198 [Phytophthora fragariae]KAE9061634.1 hypothetical protein PF007_g30188 [Phytophthora fragariae]KAE9161411.1 hypothetical protein PF005_g31258 [Phytophthora fragariae]KAE9165575.1 hypothetical protein PF002_g31331 [Phytophthora fragariae]
MKYICVWRLCRGICIAACTLRCGCRDADAGVGKTNTRAPCQTSSASACTNIDVGEASHSVLHWSVFFRSDHLAILKIMEFER